MKITSFVLTAACMVVLLCGCALLTPSPVPTRPAIMYACRPCTHVPIPPETVRIYFPAGRYEKVGSDADYTYYRSSSPILRFLDKETDPNSPNALALNGGIAVPHGDESRAFFYMDSLFSPVVDEQVSISLSALAWVQNPAEINAGVPDVGTQP